MKALDFKDKGKIVSKSLNKAVQRAKKIVISRVKEVNKTALEESKQRQMFNLINALQNQIKKKGPSIMNQIPSNILSKSDHKNPLHNQSKAQGNHSISSKQFE